MSNIVLVRNDKLLEGTVVSKVDLVEAPIQEKSNSETKDFSHIIKNQYCAQFMSQYGTLSADQKEKTIRLMENMTGENGVCS